MSRRSFKKEPRSTVFDVGSDDAKSEIVELAGDPSVFPDDLKNFLLLQQPEASGTFILILCPRLHWFLRKSCSK